MNGTTDNRPPEEIRAALDAHSTVTLAYTDADGPQACAVFYAVVTTGGDGTTRGLSLVFVTSPTTRHGRALLAGDVPVAFTAQRDGQEWTALTGIQGRGTCRRLDGAERAAAWDAYRSRFPYVEGSDRLRQAMERADLWELSPRWLRLVDNGRGFGHKSEWNASAPPVANASEGQ
ncbi:pyridoxamine 5'-phosphate oxidase family protein [Streptomyces luteireticuli]|uniref:Pyridoxamine 5'-phosphate oxidase N-terminal domain-containing protein n=1 Tax=Streptomyces luteireticuli TaxID=173858 RepID=A0ABN0Y6M3_9ACTN